MVRSVSLNLNTPKAPKKWSPPHLTPPPKGMSLPTKLAIVVIVWLIIGVSIWVSFSSSQPDTSIVPIIVGVSIFSAITGAVVISMHEDPFKEWVAKNKNKPEEGEIFRFSYKALEDDFSKMVAKNNDLLEKARINGAGTGKATGRFRTLAKLRQLEDDLDEIKRVYNKSVASGELYRLPWLQKQSDMLKKAYKELDRNQLVNQF